MKKRRKGKRLVSILLAAILTVLALPPMEGAAASRPAEYSKMTSSYKNSVYYQRLMEVELTGNQVTDLIAVAASQLGYTEGTNKNDLSGNGGGKGDCTEYGNCLGKNVLPWCASFVSWCFQEAGIPTSIMPRTASCGTLRSSVHNKGATWHGVNSGYKPKAGDLVMYEKLVKMSDGKYYYVYANRDKNGVPDTTSHVGIVVSDFNESKQTYDVIDGNGNQGKVKYLANQKLYMAGPVYGGGTMNRIQGFITPAYTTGSGSGYDGSAGTKQSLNVSLTKATDPQYTAKEKIEETNAVVVSRVSKPAGSSITSSGIILSAADGSIIKEHTERVTNVSNSTTVFHAWYDIQEELGLTLKPGVTYIYQFCAVVNGETFRGEQYKFTTKGAASSYTVKFDGAGGSTSPSSKKVTYGEVYGELPVPVREQYSFLGWYTSRTGGTMVASNTEVKLNGDQTLYAQWEFGEEEEENGSNDSSQEDRVDESASSSSNQRSSSTNNSSNQSSSSTSSSSNQSSSSTSSSSNQSSSNTSSSSSQNSTNTNNSSQKTSSSTGSSSSKINSSKSTAISADSSGTTASSSSQASYYGTGTWTVGMGGYAWKLRTPGGTYLASQWGLIDGVWYYFGSDGYTCSGWQWINGSWYYFHPNAAMATGWVFVNNHWYYLDASGAMKTGWQAVSGVWYYMDSSGAMLANTMTPDGYWVDASGAWIH